VLDAGSAVPPAIQKQGQRSAPVIALICICALVLLIGVAMVAGKSKRDRVPQHARVEAKTAIARGQLRAGMPADQCIRMLGQPTRIPANQRFEERAVDLQGSRWAGDSSF